MKFLDTILKTPKTSIPAIAGLIVLLAGLFLPGFTVEERLKFLGVAVGLLTVGITQAADHDTHWRHSGRRGAEGDRRDSNRDRRD